MAAATPPGEAGAAPPPSRLPFEVIRDPRAMRARADDLRRDGLRLAVVPTMGFLHDGDRKSVV